MATSHQRHPPQDTQNQRNTRQHGAKYFAVSIIPKQPSRLHPDDFDSDSSDNSNNPRPMPLLPIRPGREQTVDEEISCCEVQKVLTITRQDAHHADRVQQKHDPGNPMVFKTGGLHACCSINSEVMRALKRHRGIPPPGCTLPPQKYKPLSFVLRLRCRKKAERVLLELAP